MAIDTTPSTVATNALQAIPFSSLIGGPLDACVQAQAQAAMTSWEFIQQVGLTTDPNTQETKAINVTFQYQKGGQMVNLVVPLLTIVPIPYIAINEITIDFIANISASSSSVVEKSETTEYGGEVEGEMKIGWGIFSLRTNFKANYSSKKDSKATEESKYSVEYTMTVHVAAGQSDMPTGLAAILNILQSSITEAGTEGDIVIDPQGLNVNVSPGKDGIVNAYFEATVTDTSGLLLSDQEVTVKLEAVTGTPGFTIEAMEATRGTVKEGTTPTNEKLEGITDSKGVLGVTIPIKTDFDDGTTITATNLTLTEETVIVVKDPGGERTYTKTDEAVLGVSPAVSPPPPTTP
jgi:hypothetical protein